MNELKCFALQMALVSFSTEQRKRYKNLLLPKRSLRLGSFKCEKHARVSSVKNRGSDFIDDEFRRIVKQGFALFALLRAQTARPCFFRALWILSTFLRN